MSSLLTIATICARGGSIGLPGKNIKPILGKPLIEYTIEQALAVPEIDQVYVSTDAESIAEVARTAGAEVPFLRPPELARSNTPKLAVIRHLIEWIDNHNGPVNRVVDLDPTSPLRDISDIQSCLAMLDEKTDVVITAYETDKNPYFNMVEIQPDGNIRLVKQPDSEVIARQLAPKVYAMNASVYCWHRHTVDIGLFEGNVRMHIMPRERSVDIDEPLDFQIVELLMRQKHGLL